MGSANGFRLVVERGGVSHSLVAAWAAPYFVLDESFDEVTDEPMLIHCETIDDARERLRVGGNFEHQRVRVILNADFSVCA